jgi:hypothetical protein
MPEYLKENEHPLNQQSKKVLLLLKLKPQDTDLYLLQLLRECVDRNLVNLPGPYSAQSGLREFLDAFYTWSPERVQQVFEQDSGGNSVEVYPEGPANPGKFGQALIDQLDSRLTAAV